MTPIALWETERGMVSAIDFSSNGEWVATGNVDGTIKVWSIQCGTCVSKIQRPVQRYETGWFEYGIGKLIFSPDNKHIAASLQGCGLICLWDVETGELSYKLTPDPNIIVGENRTLVHRPFCFSVDGCLLASASPANTDGTTDFISVWNLKSGKQILVLNETASVVQSLAFSPCGMFLRCGDMSGVLREWDITSRKQVQAFSVHSEKFQLTEGPTPSLLPICSPSGVLHAIGVGETSITVWNVECDEKLNTFEHHENIFYTHFLNARPRDGKDLNLNLAAAGGSKISVWTLDSPEGATTISRDSYALNTLTFSPCGQTLVSGGIRFTCWDVVKRRPQHQMHRIEAMHPFY